MWSLLPGHHPRLRTSSMKQMGQRCTALDRDGSSDFRKLRHQLKHSVFTDVVVRHPRRKMALDSPDREFAHMTTQTHTHTCMYTYPCASSFTPAHAETHVGMQTYNMNNPQVQAHTRTGKHTNTTCTQPGNPLTSRPWIPLPRIPSGCREPRKGSFWKQCSPSTRRL